MFLREELEDGCLELIEPVKIGVTGIAPGAGTTFIATSLAVALARGFSAGKKEEWRSTVGFLELSGDNRPLIYDSLGMDKRFAGREFIDFYEKIRNRENIKGCFNMDEGINWALRVPQIERMGNGEASIFGALSQNEARELCLLEKIRLIHNLPARIRICDINYSQSRQAREVENRESILELLSEMDLILFVIDPMPAKLVCGYPLYGAARGLANRGSKVVWLVNKMNSGVNKRELCSFLKLKQYTAIPLLNAEDFYAAEYNCKVPYMQKTVSQKIHEQLEEIISFHQISI